MTLAQQRRLDKLAAGVLLAATVLGTTVNYFTKQGFWQPGLSRPVLVAYLLVTPLYFVQLYYSSQGRRWAKILFLVLTTLSLAGAVLDHSRIAAKYLDSTGAVINYIAQYAVTIAADILLALTLRKPTPSPAEFTLDEARRLGVD